MYFRHADEIWRDYPQLAAGVIVAAGIDATVHVGERIDGFLARAEMRLDGSSEAALPEIQAWRRAYAQMGLKPTQYRCAAEALLRRYRRDHVLPRVHPLVDLCNAVSMAYAIPVAALDVSRIAGHVEVRYADGHERYDTFAGDVEHPAAGEVVFADAVDRAHARRWTNRQSGYSAVQDGTSNALIVAEALHESAAADIAALIAELAGEIAKLWSVAPLTGRLTAAAPRFEFAS